jgi:SAM-dependent methyltransferase
VLDIGCGPGQFAEFILGAVPGVSYVGVDFSAVAVDLARARVQAATFIQADLMNDKGIIELEYDIVVALEVLEHIDTDLEVLGRLRPGARFVGSVPNFDSFGHVRFFRDADAVRARYAERITALEVTPFNLAPNSTLFLMSGVLA